MEKYLPAIGYYPTTVLFIDDDREYLESTSLLLDKCIAFYKFIDNPSQALNFFINSYSFDPFTNRCLVHPIEEALDHRTLNVDVRAIHKEANNPQRFSEISVIVIDYQMPGLEGLELCQKLKNKPFKKILLTGVLDEAVAVKAFNDGIIDQFVRKDDPNFKLVLNQRIHDLQKKYFHNLSRVIIDCMTSNPNSKADFLQDPVFADLFEQAFLKLNATEYYLMDSQGSFMFLDINGNPKWLAVKNEAEMQGLVDFAKCEDVPNEIISSLANRTHIPYFQLEEQLQTPPKHWKDFFHPASKLKGNSIYYYALIESSPLYPLPTKVLSFWEYINNNLP